MQLEFIHQDAKNRKLTDVDRRTIRRISRKVGAATRKEKGNEPKVNVLQVPDFLIAPDDSAPDSLPKGKHVMSQGKQPSAKDITCGLSFPIIGSGLPSELFVLMQPDLISKLLQFAAVSDAVTNPKRWLKICRLAQQSVVQVLPQRYGHSGCLDDAIDCVSKRIRLCFVQEADKQLAQRQVERAYGRALRSLQSSLASKSTVNWDVWYATLLLSLFELLEYNDLRNYVCHARGGFDVLYALGPSSIATEAEKDLLIAQAEIMILEATFMNVDCFLSKPDWQAALDSTIMEVPQVPVHDRSEVIVSLWKITASAPGLFRRITVAVMNQSLEEKDELVRELHGLLDKYADWSLEWDWLLVKEKDRKTKAGIPSEGTLRKFKALTRYLVFLAMANRFLTAIDPQAASYAEDAATTAASWIVRVAEPQKADSIPGVGMKLALLLGKSILATTAQWSQPELLDTIDPEIFKAWCSMIGRAT